MWPPDNTFALPTEVFSSCLAIVSAVTVGGLFLWPALRYGTGYQTVWETQPSAETPSDIHWRRFYFQLTCVHSALELSGWCALQIYLLTYLVIFMKSKGCSVRATTEGQLPGSCYGIISLNRSVSEISLNCNAYLATLLLSIWIHVVWIVIFSMLVFSCRLCMCT